jgi:hypothetical protein
MAVWYADSVMGQQWKRPVPLFGNATTIKKGAFIMRGTTDGTNQGFGIICSTNGTLAGRFIGLTEQAFVAATLDNDPSVGTKYLLTDCNIGPFSIYAAQYDNSFGANALSTTGVGATTVVSSGENISGGWLFFDNFELHYVLSSSSGTYTTKSATSAAITTTNKVAKIYYPFEPLITLTTDVTQIGTATAAQGSDQFTVLDNLIKAQGFDYISLDPTKHDALILGSTSYTPQIHGLIQSTQSIFSEH